MWSRRGSYVSDKLLRFDFSHYAKVTPEEIRQVERIVTDAIRKDITRQEYREVPLRQRDGGIVSLERSMVKMRVIQYGD